MKKLSNTYMGGTEGTGEYIVVADSPSGRVGIRPLGDTGTVRVRVEPEPGANFSDVLTRDAGWKQPGEGGQERYSLVWEVPGVKIALRLAIMTLGNSLAFATVPQLRATAKACGYKGYSRMKKAELVGLIAD